jgi:hypothetical protein
VKAVHVVSTMNARDAVRTDYAVSAMTATDELATSRFAAAANARCPASFTCHARTRGARRNIAPDAVQYVMAHGRIVHRTGATFYFLGRRDIPKRDRGASWASRLEGTIVIVAPGGVVVTVYRNRRGLHSILRKMKYRLFDCDFEPDASEDSRDIGDIASDPSAEAASA